MRFAEMIQWVVLEIDWKVAAGLRLVYDAPSYQIPAGGLVLYYDVAVLQLKTRKARYRRKGLREKESDTTINVPVNRSR
jgi:hypothetical protein